MGFLSLPLLLILASGCFVKNTSQRMIAPKFRTSPSTTFSPLNKCVKLERVPNYTTVSGKEGTLETLTVNSLGKCAQACLQNPDCVAFTVSAVVKDSFQSGDCVLAGENLSVVNRFGYYTYLLENAPEVTVGTEITLGTESELEAPLSRNLGFEGEFSNMIAFRK